MYLGKSKGFGQRFDPPDPSPYLKALLPYCKEYQRSKVTLSLIREDIKKCETNVTSTRPQDYLFDEAVRRASRAFRLKEPVPILHLNDVFQQDLPIWSASPGLPWSTYGYKTKAEVRDDPDAVQSIRWFWHRIKCGHSVSLPDCCAFIRTHICKAGDTKVRAVWGYPATVTFAEGMFAIPLIRAFKQQSTPLAYGFETGIGGMKKVWKRFNSRYSLGVDFSGFDKTVPAWLIRIAFDILALNLDFTKYQDHGTPVAGSLIHVYYLLQEYMINTKIRMCNGERYMKRSGIASGSYFTQMVGSICNYILLQYAALKSNVTIRDILVFGDDSLIATDDHFTPDDVAVVLEPLGMKVNVEKSGFSRDVSRLTFLGFEINQGYPLKDRTKQIASLVYPEHPDHTWDDVATRALGILYSNMGVDIQVDFWCRQIVTFRDFDIALTRNQQKMLDVLMVGKLEKEPPDLLEFMRRLRVI